MNVSIKNIEWFLFFVVDVIFFLTIFMVVIGYRIIKIICEKFIKFNLYIGLDNNINVYLVMNYLLAKF